MRCSPTHGLQWSLAVVVGAGWREVEYDCGFLAFSTESARSVPLAIAITAGVVTGAAALVLLAMIAALILGGPDRRLPDADLVVLFLALPFVLGALMTLGATLRWRQEASRIRPHFIPTEP